MAYPSILFLAVLFVAATPLAHSYSINGTQIAEVRIKGRLVCSVTGNALSGISNPGVAGVNVTLTCNGGQTNLAQAVTNTAGFYQVVLNGTDGLLFDPSSCFINIKLPVADCTLFPPTGNLRAVANLLNVVPSVVGTVAKFVTGLFVVVS